MFAIFDGDKSGEISLPEMKSMLDHYEELRNQQGDVAPDMDDDRLAKSEANDVPYEDIPPNDKPF
jgi:Ca2+-binding EF-hand superfamily protein